MLAELKAIEAIIETAPGYPTFLIFADPGASGQYVVLQAKGFDSPNEVPVCGPDDTIDAEVRVKATTGTADGVFIMLKALRDQLSPGLRESVLAVSGRHARLVYVRSEFIDIDQDTTITGTSRHPAFGVDTYRLISEPS